MGSHGKTCRELASRQIPTQLYPILRSILETTSYQVITITSIQYTEIAKEQHADVKLVQKRYWNVVTVFVLYTLSSTT